MARSVEYLRFSLIFVLGTLAGCSPPSPQSKERRLTGPTMGTTFSITLANPRDEWTGEPDLESIAQKVRDILQSINESMSTYDPASEISRFNASSSTEPTPISADFARVVARAVEIHEKSGGSFDITVSPLVDLWGFGSKGERETPPSDANIKAALEQVGSQHLEVQIDPPTLRKKIPGVKINLNAIAPGYAADCIARLLREMGFKHFLVDVGGEFVARGLNGQGDNWRVGVERPERAAIPKQAVELVVVPGDQAVATSGDYRQFFEHAGKFYSHTLDPKTGWPVTHLLASVTILAPDAISADGWATAVMALGPDEGMKLIEELEHVEGLLLIRKEDGSFDQAMSSGASRFILKAR